MQRAEQLIALYNRFADNYQLFSELNDALLVDCDAGEWQELLNRRSETQRRILNENEEILRQAKELMMAPVESKEEADEILVYFRRLLNTRLTDYCLLDILYRPLTDFYEKTEDALRLIGLNVSAGALAMDLFCNIEPSMSPLNAKECFERAITCGKLVSPKESPDIWMSVFSAYANMMGSCNAFYPELQKDFFHYYDEALAYFNDPELGPILLSRPNGSMFRTLVAGRIVYAVNCYEKMSKEEQERFRKLIREEIENPTSEYAQGERSALRYYMSYQIGDISADEAFRGMLKDYEAQGSADYRIKDIVITTEDYLGRYAALEYMLELLKDRKFTGEERRTLTQDVIQKAIQLVHSVPYGYMTSYVNESCSSLCTNMLPLLSKPEDIQKTVMSLLILRQPITYIHSLMVKEISVAIAEEMLQEIPEVFLPLFGKTVEEVSGRTREILSFIAQAALFHDIGKTKVAGIINNQYRRLTDTEYSYISLHTLRGPEVLLHNEAFAPYFDIMQGHHKTYDGKGGYPAEFDNTSSPYRIVIDLITIADCTDAATDILGRNYAHGKSFYDLLSELSVAKGTRYNPDIVGLMERSPGLREKLNRLTGEERRHIYYRAYRDVMNLNSDAEQESQQ
ncbi:MAG: HD-GYP domain-containing protein [Acetatifactor sp.]